jgi:hypothetical protein
MNVRRGREQELLDSLYIYLSSNVNVAKQLISSTSNFVNRLDSPLLVQKEFYEMGLVSFSYMPVNTIFGKRALDNAFQVHLQEYAPVNLSITKGPKSIDNDFETFNETFKDHKVKIERVQGKDGKSLFKMTVNQDKDYSITFSQQAAEVLGLKNTRYENQPVITDRLAIDIFRYTTFRVGHVLHFSLLIKPEVIHGVFEEPSEPTIDALATSINLGLRLKGVSDITVVSEETYLSITVDEGSKSTMFVSEKMKQILGLDTRFIGASIECHHVDLNAGNRYLLVYNDCVEPMIRAGGNKPVVRTFKQGHGTDLIEEKFNPVQYHALNQSNICSMITSVTNESEELIPFAKRDGIHLLYHLRLKT